MSPNLCGSMNIFMPKINQKQSDGNKIGALKPSKLAASFMKHRREHLFVHQLQKKHQVPKRLITSTTPNEILLLQTHKKCVNCRISKYHTIYYAYERPYFYV